MVKNRIIGLIKFISILFTIPSLLLYLLSVYLEQGFGASKEESVDSFNELLESLKYYIDVMVYGLNE